MSPSSAPTPPTPLPACSSYVDARCVGAALVVSVFVFEYCARDCTAPKPVRQGKMTVASSAAHMSNVYTYARGGGGGTNVCPWLVVCAEAFTRAFRMHT